MAEEPTRWTDDRLNDKFGVIDKTFGEISKHQSAANQMFFLFLIGFIAALIGGIFTLVFVVLQ